MYEKSVFIGDAHYPFVDEKVFSITLKFLKWFKPHYIFIVGDWVDFYQLSSFDKDPARLQDAQLDLNKAREGLEQLRQVCPKTTIIYLEGNHEARLRKYLWRHPELFSLDTMTIPSLLDLKELDIKYVDSFYEFHGFLVEHGSVIRKHSGYSAKAQMEKVGTSGISGHCFSEDTEVLTVDGWKLFPKLKIGDSVMTYNLDTGASEWNSLDDVFCYDTYKEMVHFKNQVADLLVTKDHMVVGSKSHQKFNFERVKAMDVIDKRIDMPCGGKNTNKGLEESDDFLKLCAWVITEGNYGGSTIRISQSEKPKVGIKHITDILDRLDQSYSVAKRYDKNTTKHGHFRNYDAYRITLHVSDITKRIQKLFPKKQLNTWLFKLSARQFKFFFKELILADGCKNTDATRSYQYATKWKEETGIFQALCAINGYRTSSIKRSSELGTVYCITVNTRGISSISKGGKVIDYSGKVWCGSVKNKTLLVRRNGKTIISGNSHRLGSHYLTNRQGDFVWYESGCLCSRTDVEYDPHPNWQNGFTVGYFKKNDERFNLEQVYIGGDKCAYAGKEFTSS